MQLGFGAGTLYGTPLVDATGTAIANPTPTKFGVLQEITLDIEFSTKELYGSQQFPVAIGRGQGKITGTAKNAQINGLVWAGLFFGQNAVNGILGVYTDSVGQAIPASTPWQLTIVPPSSGTFTSDLGVINAQGNPMKVVAATPTTGQYAVNNATGVYTFAAADTGLTVFINYRYTATSTTANKSTVLSEAMGYNNIFAIDLAMNYYGQQMNFHLYQCSSSKLSIATKLEDFMIPEFSFEAFADTQNRVMDWSTNQ